MLALTKYDPNQPRIPAGQPGGGRWTDGAGEAWPDTATALSEALRAKGLGTEADALDAFMAPSKIRTALYRGHRWDAEIRSLTDNPDIAALYALRRDADTALEEGKLSLVTGQITPGVEIAPRVDPFLLRTEKPLRLHGTMVPLGDAFDALGLLNDPDAPPLDAPLKERWSGQYTPHYRPVQQVLLDLADRALKAETEEALPFAVVHFRPDGEVHDPAMYSVLKGLAFTQTRGGLRPVAPSVLRGALNRIHVDAFALADSWRYRALAARAGYDALVYDDVVNSYAQKLFEEHYGRPIQGLTRLPDWSMRRDFTTPGRVSSHRTIRVLQPGRLKSLTGNQGTFDPTVEDVTKYDPNQPRDARGRWMSGITADVDAPPVWKVGEGSGGSTLVSAD